ncbi:hypothetical protein R1sor_016986 [Riccia sorocarpa]|uniref:Uncharacterized protein n=1 Tax=Riccia sorocarpa TaxID=122646 RepID=A0ABD3I7E5_9MARC
MGDWHQQRRVCEGPQPQLQMAGEIGPIRYKETFRPEYRYDLDVEEDRPQQHLFRHPSIGSYKILDDVVDTMSSFQDRIVTHSTGE